MINLLFLTTLAFASDVYEICVLETQTWSDHQQDWRTDNVSSFYSSETLQLIVHENSIEINRTKKPIQSRETIDNLPCYREHKNSLFCHDTVNNLFTWEFHYRNGRVSREVMKICLINGE